MNRFNRAALLGPLLALLLAGCGSGMFQQPEVTLEGVQIGGLGLRGGTLLVNLEVVNPNRFALNAHQLTYDLQLRDPVEDNDTTWVQFARGTYDVPFTVGARETARVQIPVEFSYSGIGSAANSLLRSGTFSYRASGVVDVRTPIGTHGVPFNRRGTVTLLNGSGR
jgi:LEA14-like dessication related protein